VRRLHVDERDVAYAVDHAANRIAGPLARRHQLGVPGQDRRAAEPVLLFHHDAVLSDTSERVRGRKARRSAPDDEDWLVHFAASICL
jgi:hypothetical protein